MRGTVLGLLWLVGAACAREPASLASDAAARADGAAVRDAAGAVEPRAPDAAAVDLPDVASPLDATPSARDAGAVGAPDAAPIAAPCPGTCVAHDRVARCAELAGQRTYVEEACPAGSGCIAGACTAGACSDECELGQRRCRVWDMAAMDWAGTDGAARPEDRARLYEKWLRSDTASLFHDGIVSVRYTDARRTAVGSIYLGDTALHTGLYLAAEATRLELTQSARARNTVLDLVAAIDLWFHVSGDPAVLATIAVPAGDARVRQWTDWDCAQFDRHCDVAYGGARYDFVGDPSRDMYVGPLLGLALAYDALTERDAAVKARVRELLVVLAEEVIRLRTLSVVFEINGTRLPPRDLAARYFVPDQREMVDGRVFVTIDTGDLDNSGAITGGQEFMPNPSQFFRQVSLLSRLPDIPRSSSAMMVAAMLRAAIHASEGVPAYAARRQALLDYYLGNADGWGNVEDFIRQAAASTSTRECGERYFGFNISFIPAYVWARYEDDPRLRARVVEEVLGGLWSQVESHDNAFFGAMTAELTPGLDAAVARMVGAQVAHFPSPPRVRRAVDLRGDAAYSARERGCTDQLEHSRAVDSGDRPAYYFSWHSHPWALLDPGDERQTYPGHDYLVAYWMARRLGALGADRPSTCLRIEP